MTAQSIYTLVKASTSTSKAIDASSSSMCLCLRLVPLLTRMNIADMASLVSFVDEHFVEFLAFRVVPLSLYSISNIERSRRTLEKSAEKYLENFLLCF
jgi:hypothetical protein